MNNFDIKQDNDILYLDFKNKHIKPFYIDFNNYLNRAQQEQELIQAIRIKNMPNLHILDTTAGLGRDSFILANYNFQITMLERNKIIYLLLQNAIDRALKNNIIKDIVSKINLINQDSINYLNDNNLSNIDIIYIDPMYPISNKTRLVKKDMQIFRHIVKNDEDANELFELSWRQNIKKIVVKRMLKSPYITDKIKTSYEIRGTTTRFDVYVKNTL